MSFADDMAIAEKHPRWDAKSLRIILSAKEIEALPVKTIDKSAQYEKMSSLFWNGTELYPEGVKIFKDEQGYDLQARYIVR